MKNGQLIRRWVLNFFRSLHVAGLIGSGSVLFGGTSGNVFPLLLLGSGLAMAALDIWSNPDYLRQVAGLWLFLKLSLVAWLALDEVRAPIVFWLLVFLSVLVAHAPGSFRHRRLGRSGPAK